MVAQSVAVPSAGRWTAQCDLGFYDGPNDGVRFWVADGQTGRRLAETARKPGRGTVWTKGRVDFDAPPGRTVRVGLTLHGPAGVVQADNVAMRPFTPTFPVQKFTPGSAEDDLLWKRGGVPAIKLPADPAIEHVREMLLDELGANPDSPGQQPGIAIALSDAPQTGWPASERYHLTVAKDGMRIEAGSLLGVRWGLVTLLELGHTDHDTWHVPACEIDDWPDMPLRWMRRYPLPAVESCRRALRWKLNGLLISDPQGFWNLDKPDVRETVTKAFATVRSFGLEPTPIVAGFGHAYVQVRHDARFVEGRWVRDRRIVLRGAEPTELADRNIIRTPTTDIVLTDEGGRIRYELGKDYEVIDGTMNLDHPEQAKPFSVRRTDTSRIPDGAQGGAVLASYDVGGRAGNPAYCPSEPLVHAYCLPVLRRMVESLRPKYFHIGRDQIERVNGDSRCQKRGMTITALIA